MNKTIVTAVLLSAIAAAALVLSFRSSVTVDSLVGFVGVLALLGIASLEYRINWKRLFSRS